MGVGWSEIFVIALVAILVFGPHELPQVLRTAGRALRQAQSIRRDFERQVGDALREAERDVGLTETLRPARPSARRPQPAPHTVGAAPGVPPVVQPPPAVAAGAAAPGPGAQAGASSEGLSR